MIRIVACGVGNVRAYLNLYRSIGVPADVALTPDDLADASQIILPGVGSFDWAMTRLAESGIRDRIEELVLVRQVPILAVCVGMQMLGARSEEGQLPGLGWLNTEVRKFERSSHLGSLPMPHMGWNDIRVVGNDALFRGLEQGARFYFLHSYYVHAFERSIVAAESDYGGEFVCAVKRDNIFGVQFHPEKSHRWGMQLLKNFSEI
jgi:glutamine amidotransferase